MKVIAAQGLRCPMEGRPRDYIADSAPVEVPQTAYYLRLVSDGSLKVVEGTVPKGSGGAAKGGN